MSTRYATAAGDKGEATTPSRGSPFTILLAVSIFKMRACGSAEKESVAKRAAPRDAGLARLSAHTQGQHRGARAY